MPEITFCLPIFLKLVLYVAIAIGRYHIAVAITRFVYHLFIYFDLGFTASQDYFTHFEPSHSLGGAKTGDQEKPPDHPQAELNLSHRPKLGSDPQQ